MPDEGLPDVPTLYEELFEADPLVLDEKTQRTFGNQILLNLLVERAISATEPTPVSLGDGNSRADFKGSNAADTPKITKEQRRAYENSRLHRTPIEDLLSASELKDLKKVTMLANAELTKNRLERENAGTGAPSRPKYENDDKAREDLKSSGSPLDTRLKIATIGYRVTISKIRNRGLFGEELVPCPILANRRILKDLPEKTGIEKLRRTKLRPKAQRQRWLDAITRHIKLALTRKSNFLVLPEFSLPPDMIKSRSDVADSICEIADAFGHEFFLFSGSRHEGGYNRGFILSREANKDVSGVWWHYKIASARSLGENIMGPQTAKLPSYNFTIRSPDDQNKTIDYRVLIAICYDIFDPTTFINYVVQCAEAEADLRETIILVPSFNPGREFVAALRDLSFIASCPVIYVNGLHGDARLYLYGFSIDDWVTLESSIPNGVGPAQAESQFDKSLREMQQRLDADMEKAKSQFRSASSLERQAADPAIRAQIQMVARTLSARRELLEERGNLLRGLIVELGRLRQAGALRHLITTEACDRCANQTHSEDDYCPNDVLYYNIDVRLLWALSRFREQYFAVDDFLPLPFRRDEKRKISSKIWEKKQKRMQQNA